MRGPLTALLAPAILLTVAPAAPVPKEKDPPYFPTQVGSRWIYQDGKREEVRVVTEAERKGGVAVVTVGAGSDGSAPFESVSVSEGGLYRVAVYGRKVTPPVCVLKLPHRPGDTWLYEDDEEKATFTAGAREWVEVPAGKFRSARVEVELVLRGKPARLTFWYAPGVGLVKKLEGDRATVLKSFTPGKD